ncbi:helix-turn-helix transcriptional regulator [Hymenobacter sediminis]|uniref:response regulator transcription factor n=1 Tax=Hymenobacter sediminis TaxID=2218621 RepID=UPI000DA695FB|nr:LuxR C-terminal-related transcriptional regulator [Hymenobacter sediminis]RPD46386.1 helix-turn-helix transcriptional regulator [Hymenobacter sediminis]
MLLESSSPASLADKPIQDLLQSCHALQQHSDEYLLVLIRKQAPSLADAKAFHYLRTLRLLLQSGVYLWQLHAPTGPLTATDELQPDEKAVSNLSLLSSRELEILPLLAQGYTLPQIGEQLFISSATVNNHCARIREKLGLKGRNALIAFAVSNV